MRMWLCLQVWEWVQYRPHLKKHPCYMFGLMDIWGQKIKKSPIKRSPSSKEPDLILRLSFTI